MRWDRLGDPIDQLLDRPLADGYAKHRATEILHRTVAVALGACHLPDQCGEPRTLACGMLRGRLSLVDLAAVEAAPSMEHKVCDLHANLGKLDHLMV